LAFGDAFISYRYICDFPESSRRKSLRVSVMVSCRRRVRGTPPERAAHCSLDQSLSILTFDQRPDSARRTAAKSSRSEVVFALQNGLYAWILALLSVFKTLGGGEARPFGCRDVR
jgi:hypothetical protein